MDARHRRPSTALLKALVSIGLVHVSRGRGRELHPTQGAILDLLDEEPGLNHTEICEQLNLARGTAQYHLRELEDDDRIHQVSSGRETHYFRTTVPRDKAEKVATLRAGRAMEILDAVQQEEGMMQQELLESIGMTRKVLRGHVDRLAEEQLVEETAVGRKRRYFLTETYEDLEGLLRNETESGSPVGDGDQPR